jgi:CheY-like chemotaxis protein
VSAVEAATALILVADDDDDLLELACMQLEDEGFQVERARDGSEALRLAHESRPDLCVFDVHMPGLQGHEVLREMRNEPDTKGIPVILTTATLHERSFWRIGPRPDDFLRKSREILELGDRVRRVLEQSNGNRANGGGRDV